MIEAPEKSSSPLEASRILLGGDGGDPVTTTGLVTVYTQAVAPSKGADIVAAARDVLQMSVVAVVGQIGANHEISGGGAQTTSLATVELVLVESPSVPASVDTAGKVPGVEEKSRSWI